MFKTRTPIPAKPRKLTRHEVEMAALREHHKRVMQDATLRAKTLVSTGAFVQNAAGELEVSPTYAPLFAPAY